MGWEPGGIRTAIRHPPPCFIEATGPMVLLHHPQVAAPDSSAGEFTDGRVMKQPTDSLPPFVGRDEEGVDIIGPVGDDARWYVFPPGNKDSLLMRGERLSPVLLRRLDRERVQLGREDVPVGHQASRALQLR